MNISIVVAMSENNVIGIDGHLPWYLPEDLQHFKRVTMGKPVIMGRNTFDSIGKALPGRKNIVLTRDPKFVAPNCFVAKDIDEAINLSCDAPEVMIIGGGNIYRQFLPKTKKIYMTIVNLEVQGDTSFPLINMKEWKKISSKEFQSDTLHGNHFIIQTLVRD